MIDSKKLKEIVRFCQKNGIVKFKSGDFEVEIKEKPRQQTYKPGPELKGTPEPEYPTWDSLSPEQQLLYSSTPSLPTS